MGCGPMLGASSLKHNTYAVPAGWVADARLATYLGRSSPSQVWNSPQSSTVSNVRPNRSSSNASATVNSAVRPRSSAFFRASAIAVSAMSAPRTGSPSEAASNACSPVPQPASSTLPANPPSDATRTKAACGLPMSHGAGLPSRYDASHDRPDIRSWLVGGRPPDGPSASATDRSGISGVFPLSAGEGRGEPPAVVLRVADAVLAQSVVLVRRFAVDPRAGRLGVRKVRVDVRHDHLEAAGGSRRAFWRGHLVLRGDRVEPDGAIAGPDFAVHDGSLVGAVQTPGGESEDADQEVVGLLDVLVDEDGEHGRTAHGLAVGGVLGGGHDTTMRAPVPRNLGQT